MGAFEQAAELKDILGAGFSPEHARLLETPTDDRFAARFDHAGNNKVFLLAKISVTSALDVGGEVGDLTPRGFLALRVEVGFGF